MDFLRIWLTGLLQPSKAMKALSMRPGPFWGLRAVLVRFVGTSLLVSLPLALLGRTPFQQSYIEFIQEEDYYLVLVFLLPVFGLVAWLLMSSVAHVALRLFSRHTDFDQIANIIGMSMLIPMPIVWAWDITMILTGAYGLATLAPSHALFQIWETILGMLGFRRILSLATRDAILVAIAINLIYVLMGAFFSR